MARIRLDSDPVDEKLRARKLGLAEEKIPFGRLRASRLTICDAIDLLLRGISGYGTRMFGRSFNQNQNFDWIVRNLYAKMKGV